MDCWNCGAHLEDPPMRKLSFRAVCDKCNMGLHCCKNCKYYKPGLANDCMIPGTERISDRSANNFCEEFSLLGKAPAAPNRPSKQGFEDLFK